jgi:hypothetical protein
MPKKLTAEEFIERATERFGNVCDFSKSEYVDIETDVVVTCKLHGDYRKPARTFIYANGRAKHGCPQCAKEAREEANRRQKDMAKASFVERAIEKHGHKFNYDKFEYTKAHERSIVTCPEHGDFRVTPNDHATKGRGCSKCFLHTGRTIVYLVHIESHGEEMLKIGITNQTTDRRFRDGLHPDQQATEIATLEFKERSDAKTIEAYLHTKHRKYKFTPKVKFAGHTECFNIEALETIKQDFGV